MSTLFYQTSFYEIIKNFFSGKDWHFEFEKLVMVKMKQDLPSCSKGQFDLVKPVNCPHSMMWLLETGNLVKYKRWRCLMKWNYIFSCSQALTWPTSQRTEAFYIKKQWVAVKLLLIELDAPVLIFCRAINECSCQLHQRFSHAFFCTEVLFSSYVLVTKSTFVQKMCKKTMMKLTSDEQ